MRAIKAVSYIPVRRFSPFRNAGLFSSEYSYMTYEYEIHEREEKVKLEMVDAMFEKNKLTDEEISSISGILLEEIQKRRSQHQK